MAEKTTVTITCDVCGREMWSGEPESKERPRKLVQFDADYEPRRRGVKPYLGRASMNLCDECADKGIRIHACGAMGYNDYHIKGD